MQKLLKVNFTSSLYDISNFSKKKLLKVNITSSIYGKANVSNVFIKKLLKVDIVLLMVVPEQDNIGMEKDTRPTAA